MLLDGFGETVQPGVHVGMLLSLDESERARQPAKILVPGDSTEHRDADRGDCVCRERAVARAGDTIEDDTCYSSVGIVGREAAYNRRRGLRLAGYVDSEDDRQPIAFGQIRRGAGAARFTRGSVKEAH